jgi:PEP-CTERM motif-containing protein
MKRLLLSLIAIALMAFTASPASADPVSINFCPGDPTCPVGVTEASLTFEEILGGDPNDYNVTLRITGDSTAPAYVDEVMFKVSSAQISDYATHPTLSTAPTTGTPWIPYFDNVSGSPGSCTSDTGQQHAVCGQSGPGNSSNFGGELTGETLIWTFNVNFVDSFGTIGLDDGLLLRAQFLTSTGRNAGILSPVPEPATLFLTAIGALIPFVGRRRRTAARRP